MIKEVISGRKLIKNLLDSDLIANRYYAFGLAIQKGAPFLIIPAITWAFGLKTYADYVLTFAAAQVVAMVLSLGTTNSLIVFWYRHQDKECYLRSLMLLVATLNLVIGLLAIVVLVAAPILPLNVMPHLLWAFLIVGYATIYNGNAVGLSLIRVTGKSKQYFYVSAATAVLLVISIVVVGHTTQGVVPLVAIFMAVVALQSILFMRNSRVRIVGSGLMPEYGRFVRKILGYSIPIVGYTLITISVFTLDKWVMKRAYPSTAFTQYVLNFQFAYAVNIISVVIGMYLLPMFCRLVESKKLDVIGQKMLPHYSASLIGTAIVGSCMYGYGWVTGVHLTTEFWILVLAFGFANLFTINVMVLEALRDSRGLTFLAFTPTIIFWVAFVYAARSNVILGNYSLFLAYYVTLFVLTILSIRRRGIHVGLLLNHVH